MKNILIIIIKILILNMKLLYEQLKRINKVNFDKFYLLERTKLEENKYKFNINKIKNIFYIYL